MTPEQIKELRELYKNGFFLFTDNAKIFNSKLDKSHIIWDDNLGIAHTIRPNTNFQTRSQQITVETLCYEAIQYIGSNVDKEELTRILSELKTKGIIDDEKITMILNEYKK